MTPAEGLAYLTAAARAERAMITKTSLTRLMYLTDLRAARHGSPTTGLTWEKASQGPFCRTVGYLTKNVEIDLAEAPAWYGHAQAVALAFGKLNNTDLGMTCKASAPMRKAQKMGDILDLTVTSTNDPTAAATCPAA